MEQHGLLDEDDRKKFEKEFVQTGRGNANVCPGVSMRYHWSSSEALKLDEQNAFQPEVDARIREAVRVWGAHETWDDIIPISG